MHSNGSNKNGPNALNSLLAPLASDLDSLSNETLIRREGQVSR